MQLFGQSGFLSKSAHLETHWRETTPMQSMRLCYNNIRRSEEAQNRPLLGKAIQMHNSFPALQERCWKFTLWRSTQEKRLSSVTSATMLALSLVICSSTWWRTLGRSLSSATNAVKLTHERTCSAHKAFQNSHDLDQHWHWPMKKEKISALWLFIEFQM